MNYYIDTEFLEGTQDKRFLDFEFLEGDVPVKIFGLNIPKWLVKPNNTIQPISVGIVAEDGREYYAISKEFNLKEAWNRWQVTTGENEEPYYWIRENILKPIYQHYIDYQQSNYEKTYHWELTAKFDYKTMKRIIKWIGKSNKQIAEEIKEFIQDYKFDDTWEYGDRYDSLFGNGVNNTYYFVKDGVKSDIFVGTSESEDKPVFYAYYADYDWVVFCWLFGKMNDLPSGFPYYCRDLKQIADDIWEKTGKDTRFSKGQNEHNALADAKWNKAFHKFLNSL